jgi:hypothetical protein
MTITASIITVTIYFPTLITAVVAAWLLISRVNSHNTIGTEVFVTPYATHWIKRSFTALFLYFFINLLAETLAWFFFYMKWHNNAIYGFNYALNVPAIFVFFAVHAHTKLFTWYLAASYAGLIAVYFYFDLWLNNESLPFLFGIWLFAGISVASILFLASNLISYPQRPNKFKIQLGLVFLVYNFLSLFVTVFKLDHEINGLNIRYISYANIVIASLFYLCAGIVMLKLYKNRFYAH